MESSPTVSLASSCSQTTAATTTRSSRRTPSSFIDDHPRAGTRVRAVYAIDASGNKLAVPLQAAPFGERSPPGTTHNPPTGPSIVERSVEGGTIGWLTRHESRGVPLPAGQLTQVFAFDFGRMLTPDPDSHLRMILGIGSRSHGPGAGKKGVCFVTLAGGGAGGSCSTTLDKLFSENPFAAGETSLEGGEQFTILSGVASDDVETLQLYLGTGVNEPIPLRDNVFVTQIARTDYPARIVAFDRDQRIIGIQTINLS